MQRMARLQSVSNVLHVIKRDIGIMAPVLNKVDPIQKLFVDKIREFKEKSSSGKLEMAPELKQRKTQELEKIAKNVGSAAGADLTQFPTFKFTDPPVDVTAQAITKK